MVFEKTKLNHMEFSSNLSCVNTVKISTSENCDQEMVHDKSNNSSVMIEDNQEDELASSKTGIKSKNENDEPQENQQETIASGVGGVENQEEPAKSLLMTPKDISSSNSGTTNMSLVQGLNQPFLASKEEIKKGKGRLTISEKEQFAKLFPGMTASFALSSALAFFPAACESAVITAPSTPGVNNDENDNDYDDDNMEDDVDLNSLLSIVPLTPMTNGRGVAMNLRNERSLNFPNSPTGVADAVLLETRNADFRLARDDFLLENTVSGHIASQCSQHQQSNIPPLSPENNNSSIEKQHILLNGLIAKSLSETITLMDNMRHQSQKIQQQLEQLGVLPCKPILKLKSEVEDVCTNTHNIFASWQPPLVPINNSIRQHKRRRASGKETFPMKLHRLLLDLEHVDDGSSIATFLPDGSAFVIKDTCNFEKTVLKMYFPRMKNFSSFHRQLNLYDFERLGSFAPVGQAKGAYSHTLFHRDQSAWAALMRPTRIKGGTSAAATAAEKQHSRQKTLI